MKKITVKFTWLDPTSCQDLQKPAYQSSHASGMDVMAVLADSVSLAPGEICLIPTGFAVAIPEGYEIQVRPRSGLAVKHGVTVINSPGTIDADYRGEVRIGLVNLGPKPFAIKRGDRIAQLVLAQVSQLSWDQVETLDDTKRGSGGFGHTGM